MRLRALPDDHAASGESAAIPSWGGGCPSDVSASGSAAANASGVKVVGPDDTARQPETRLYVRDVSRSATRRRSASQDRESDELEERYREAGQWDDLVDLYTSLIEVAPTDEKRDLYERLADVLWRELADAKAARDALVEALVLDPSDDAIADYLEDIALSRDGGWNALVDAIAARMLLCPDNPTKARLAERVVRWARGVMSDAATADRFLASMRSLDPAHPLVHQRMAEVYEGVGARDAQRDSLERALARAELDEDRSKLHSALGALLEDRPSHRKTALEHYESALAIDPHNLPALEGLERIFRTDENYAGLSRVLGAQVDAAREKEDLVGALLRLGELLEKHFVRPREAVLRYEQALDLDPEVDRAADGVERCWHALRDWDKLAAALERRAAAAREPAGAIAALERLAEVRDSKQQDASAAFAAWRRLYELDTAHVVAIQRLSKLSEKSGDVIGAAAYRARLADLSEDPREKARIHVAVGEMLAPEDRDPACARIHFERAVEMDPRCAVAWEQLQKLAVRAGDMMYATFCLERRAENADSPRVKAQLLVDLAMLRTSLGDTRGALATYEYAFETDPTNEVTARAVLEDWVRREKWGEAQRACDVLVAGAARDRDDAKLLKLLRLSTRIALALGDVDRALVAAAAATDLAPSDPGARDDVLHVCYQLRERASVRERITALVRPIVKGAMDLEADALVQLGDIRIATGDAPGGVEMLCLALARQGDHVGALSSLAEAFVRRRDWGRAANCKQRLARATSDPTARRDVYLEAADLWEQRCKAPARAAAVLEELIDLGDHATTVLRRLVALWEQLGHWEKLVATLQVLGEQDGDPVRHAKHVHASAGVVRERIGDPRRAARLYEKVLDLDPTRLEAFEHLVRIWTDAREWRELELSYRRMLARVAAGADRQLEHALHHQLGLVYRDRLGDLPSALEAFRAASRAAPGDEEDRRIVTELLVLGGQEEQAIGEMRASLLTDATRTSTYRELMELFLRQQTPDRAWCAADALCHLRQADATCQRFVEDFPPVTPAEVTGTLAPCAWDTHLLTPGLDRRLSEIFRVFVPAVLRARLRRVAPRALAKALGPELRPEDSASAARLVQLVHDVAEVLGVGMPRLHARPKLTAPLSVAPTAEPALFVSLPALESVAPDLHPFLVARRLAELRPELVAHALFPTLSELRSVLKGALRVAVATRVSPPKHPDEAAVAAALGPAAHDALREVVSAVVGAGTRADIRAWHQQVDLSASRAALLVCGDIDVAWRAIQRDPRSPADLTATEWRAEMLRFLVSDEHYDLRCAIGANVEARI
jgi:tetratricopeptide (TPR) repeat protein